MLPSAKIPFLYPSKTYRTFHRQLHMAHYNFLDDLKDGHQAEEEVIELLPYHFPGIEGIERSTSKGYDIQASFKGDTLTFEVKYDIAVERTGNIAIEYESRGKQSGIVTSKANYWVYKFLGRFFIFPTVVLKKKIFEEQAFDYRTVGGDWGSNTRIFLVEAEKFQSWGKELLPPPPEK